MKPLRVSSPFFQLDAGAQTGGRGGRGGGLQEATVVEEAEDAATLLSKGIQDEAVLCDGERRSEDGLVKLCLFCGSNSNIEACIKQ